MLEPARVALYADLSCPYAYITAYRLRQLRDEYRGRVVIEHRSLALEYVNREPTPKPVLDNELPVLVALAEPGLPYQPWHRPPSEWPVTMWPAFEAVKSAERQGAELADDLAWAIRVAFFAESRCVSMRHVLLELAEQVRLDVARFREDFDAGVTRPLVIAEARRGWEELRVDGSPTFVLPSGRQVSNPGLPEVNLDGDRHWRVSGVKPAPCVGAACLDVYRALFDEALAS